MESSHMPREFWHRERSSGSVQQGSECLTRGVRDAQPDSLTFTIPGSPVPKPRQTRSDRWKKRPSVLRYRDWADRARDAARKAIDQRFPGLVLYSYKRISANLYFPLPASWNNVTKERMKGQPHELRPDIDNCGKAILDAIYPTGDSAIYKLDLEKRWDDGADPRVELTFY